MASNLKALENRIDSIRTQLESRVTSHGKKPSVFPIYYVYSVSFDCRSSNTRIRPYMRVYECVVFVYLIILHASHLFWCLFPSGISITLSFLSFIPLCFGGDWLCPLFVYIICLVAFSNDLLSVILHTDWGF